MFKNKYVKYTLIALLIVWCIVSAIQSGGDFGVFMFAAKKLRNHQDVYLPPYFYIDLKYFYSPLFALLLVPFTYIPEFIIESLWLMFSLYLTRETWLICESYFDITLLPGKAYKRWIFISFFYIITFLLYNLSMIQMTIFTLWATMQSLKFAEQKKNTAAGALLALAINIKIMPLVFLPYLLYRNYGKAFIATLFFSVVYLFIPAIFVGYDFNNQLLVSWWHTINPSGGEHLLETGFNLHSIVSTTPVFLTDTPNKLGVKMNFASLDVATVERISNLVRLFFIFLLLYFLRTLPFKNPKNRLSTIWECSYLLLITPLIFPHQNKYCYCYLLPAFMYLIYFFTIAHKTTLFRQYKPWLIFLLVISIIYTPIIGRDIMGNYLFDLIQLARVQVLCTMLLVIPLAVLTPAKLAKLQELYVR